MIIYAIYYIYYMCFIYTHIHNHIYFISKIEFSFSLLCLPALETGSGLPQPMPQPLLASHCLKFKAFRKGSS